jgi:hypothetical protein
VFLGPYFVRESGKENTDKDPNKYCNGPFDDKEPFPARLSTGTIHIILYSICDETGKGSRECCEGVINRFTTRGEELAEPESGINRF